MDDETNDITMESISHTNFLLRCTHNKYRYKRARQLEIYFGSYVWQIVSIYSCNAVWIIILDICGSTCLHWQTITIDNFVYIQLFVFLFLISGSLAVLPYCDRIGKTLKWYVTLYNIKHLKEKKKWDQMTHYIHNHTHIHKNESFSHKHIHWIFLSDIWTRAFEEGRLGAKTVYFNQVSSFWDSWYLNLVTVFGGRFDYHYWMWIWTCLFYF